MDGELKLSTPPQVVWIWPLPAWHSESGTIKGPQILLKSRIACDSALHNMNCIVIIDIYVSKFKSSIHQNRKADTIGRIESNRLVDTPWDDMGRDEKFS